ncbi:hypothetical protein Nhal_3661 [Nitrosococcus halophilus Nc 4]|uniref:Uncharacterized protein n=2 Tax=Nitrosococcus halophilus TaxID=133539 RepID=D5C2K9_NITHN|nr:hypothetical protein Nhal_3661 [Nitrosococcus halophilus Nc 4]
MEWFFHIGPNKTGTTTIQFALHEARTALLSNNNCLYPEKGILHAAHHMLNFSLNKEINGRAPYAEALGVKDIPAFDELVDDIRREAMEHGAKKIIVSSETMWTWNIKRIRRLENVLKGDKAVTVIVAKPHLERELSMWQEEVKHGFVGTPTSYLKNYGDSARLKEALVLTERARWWREAGFNILPLCLQPRLGKMPLWDYFLSNTVGATIGGSPTKEYRNVSLSYLTITSIRNAMALFLDKNIKGAQLGRNEKMQPLRLAFDIVDKVKEQTKGTDRLTLPAYSDFLVDKEAMPLAVSYFERYVNDITSLFRLSGRSVDFDRLIEGSQPLGVFQNLIDENREEYESQRELAKYFAQKIVNHI